MDAILSFVSQYKQPVLVEEAKKVNLLEKLLQKSLEELET